MNTRIKFSTKRIFALTLTTLLLNATNMHAENAQDQQDSRNITSNITTLGTANDVSGLNTVLGTLATAANLAIVDNIVDDILVDTAVIGTAVIGGIVATIGGVLGDPDDAIEGSGSISAALGGMAGAGFVTGTDSLQAISENTTTVPLATLANQTTQGLVALATSAQVGTPAVGTIAGNIGSPLVDGFSSTLAIVLGDPTASTGAASISAALGNPAGASISADIIAMQTDVDAIDNAIGVIDGTVNAILLDTAVIGTAINTTGTTTIGGVLGNPNDAITGSGSISAALGGMAGAAFATGTDSLEAISNNTTTVPLATLANQTTQGLVALATSTQAVDIQGVGFATGDNSLVAITADIAAMQTDVDAILVDTAAIGAPTVATLASTVALVLGDPTAETGAASISAALGTPAGASISADIAAMQTDVDAILADTAVIGTPAAGTIASNIGNATASTGQASIS